MLTCLFAATITSQQQPPTPPKTCRKIQIENDKLHGECCVTYKDNHLKVRDEILGLLEARQPLGSNSFVPNLDIRPPFTPNMRPHWNNIMNSKPFLQDLFPSMSPESHNFIPNAEEDTSLKVPTDKEAAPTNVPSTTEQVAESTETPGTEKTVLDNRNSIAVPKNECPQGQGRDVSGACVDKF